MKCKHSGCTNSFHEACTTSLAICQQNSNEDFICPQHYCAACFHVNPENIKRQKSGQLLRCALCPLACHASDYCLPAGSKLLGSNLLKCPRHTNLSPSETKPSSANFCYACGGESRLLKCTSCPTCYHAACIGLENDARDMPAWKCPDCRAGKFLKFGQIVWVKYRKYPWWPGQIVHPRYASKAINNERHTDGQFIVHFFGSNDFVWTNSAK